MKAARFHLSPVKVCRKLKPFEERCLAMNAVNTLGFDSSVELVVVMNLIFGQLLDRYKS